MLREIIFGAVFVTILNTSSFLIFSIFLVGSALIIAKGS